MLPRRAFVLIPVVPVLRAQEGQRTMFGNAEAYERFMGRWSRLVAPRLIEFAGFPKGARVLDVGSGTGSMAFAIAEHDNRAHVVGIDPSKEYVAYANSRNQFTNRASFQLGDAQQLSFPDSTFDAAVALLVFNFIPDPRKALLEVCRVTKPGGRIAAAVWDYGDGMRMLRAFWDAAVKIDPAAAKLDEKNMKLRSSGELSALWKEAGLEDVKEQPIVVTTRFTSFADYWDSFLLGQGPAGAYVTNLDNDKRKALRTELKKTLSVSTEEAAVVLTARVWAVRGTVRK